MAADDLKARLPRPLDEQDCCISLHPADEGYVVRVDCDDYDAAVEVFDWLSDGCFEARARIEALEAQLAARDAEVATMENALSEAIEWDGYDDEGVPAVWLKMAQSAINRKDEA